MLKWQIFMSLATVGRGSVAHFECPNGTASLSQEGAVVLIKMMGRLDAAIGKQLATALDTVLANASQSTATFWDLEAMEHYHSDVRVLCTQALLRNRARVASIQTLATNRIVKMGVAVANVALSGRVRNTENRTEFESLLRKASR
jgi:hypothetical protein